MDGPILQNLISKGLGVAARKVGSLFTVLRPQSNSTPLSSVNQIIKLYAAFNAEDASFRRVAGYGDAVWWGVFDSLYTRPGDYLTGSDVLGDPQVFFIAGQRPLLPAQCVKTNRVVNVLRTPSPRSGGYGGMVQETALIVIQDWPASLLAQSARVSGTLPETRYGTWTLLLPSLPENVLVGDVVSDDIGRTFLVATAEQSDLGWRMIVKQVAG